MKRISFFFLFLILSVFLFLKTYCFGGQQYRYVYVSYEIRSVTEFSVSGNPQPLIIDSMEAGQSSAEVYNDSTMYSFASNEWTGYKKITGRIDQSMPAYTYLKVNLESYTGESQGDVTLTTSEQNLVAYIEDNDWDCIITYKFGATPAAGVLSGARTVTFTLSDM